VGLGRDDSTALKEAQATGYPREKMYGVWWAGAETDVKDVGDGAKGYNAVACKHGQPRRQGGQGHPVQLYDKGQGTASNKSEVGDVLYIRGCGGLLRSRPSAPRRRSSARARHDGRAGALGLENLNMTQARLDELGFNGILRRSRPAAPTTWARLARISTWDGKEWKITSDWYEADRGIVDGVNESSAKYAAEHKITPRTCQ
jgi:branched-chain amino acid transport system substrate-binding protein